MFREEEFFTYKVRLFQMTVYIMRLNNERFFYLIPEIVLTQSQSN